MVDPGVAFAELLDVPARLDRIEAQQKRILAAVEALGAAGAFRVGRSWKIRLGSTEAAAK